MSTGLLPPPSGVTPNFNSGILSGTQVAFILAYTITLALASSTLGIRLYTRISIMKSFGLDDVAILLSFMCSIAYFAISVNCMRFGFGRHLWEVTPQQMAQYLKQLSPMVATYALAPAFTKLSILILLHRVNPSRYFRLSCYIVALIIITYTLTISLIVAIPCIPTNPKNGECLNKCGLWQAIFNILTDSAILILPSYMLYLLKLPLRQKLAVGSIFGTGIFVIIICVVRITYIMALQDNPDVLYTQGRAAIWSTVEVNIGIFCNTLVVLRPFFRQYFPGLFSSQILSDDHHHHHGTPDHEANLRSGKRRILKLREDHSLSTLAINNRVGEEDKEPGILRRFEVKVESFSIGGSSDERTRRDSEEEIQR
ncbi:hypothetical protein sscle_02g020800 [Sclerotinia sclerotiorum 1980 UF-70]|uniref:Rhodopsin domain-containing protein n=1 Tax=Sclerotinia sclerotiorum (strain ATCC 18683 / 1980 / Ss-1) TaxID=665079 RepID=A0A1D9PX97_SCLS1|nr:hypothetical protein sscle_02g020800 [Sclerotinia sclerotiorum 1980 UF-70]